MMGGGQESLLRSGTENLIGIAGFAAAAEASYTELDKSIETMRQLREYAIGELSNLEVKLNLPAGESAPHVINLTLPQIKSETMLNFLSGNSICVSSGSACFSHGKGVSTWPNGERYVGRHRYGEFTGRGTYTDCAGRQYGGFWKRGKLLFNDVVPKPGSQFHSNFTGHGYREYINYKYEGDFLNGLWHGYGIAEWNDGSRYEGEWRDDKQHGYGVMVYPNGVRYEGEWKQGSWHGHGKYTGPKHDFEGEFVQCMRHGRGVTRYKDGSVYEGPYVNDKRHGEALYTFANGTRMICTYVNGVITGNGEKYYIEGGVYKGELNHEGRPHGMGVWELADGSRYEGEHEKGYRHGEGVLIMPDGTRYEGMFDKDVYVGPKKD